MMTLRPTDHSTNHGSGRVKSACCVRATLIGSVATPSACTHAPTVAAGERSRRRIHTNCTHHHGGGDALSGHANEDVTEMFHVQRQVIPSTLSVFASTSFKAQRAASSPTTPAGQLASHTRLIQATTGIMRMREREIGCELSAVSIPRTS